MKHEEIQKWIDENIETFAVAFQVPAEFLRCPPAGTAAHAQVTEIAACIEEDDFEKFKQLFPTPRSFHGKTK